METTIDLPDALVREIELRALQEGRKLKEVVADLLTAAVATRATTTSGEGQGVSKNLPLIKVRLAQPTNGTKLTTQEWCDWLKEMDLQLEVERYEKALGHQHVDRADAGNAPAS